MKKILIAIMAIFTAIVCVFGFTACDDENSNKGAGTGTENEAGTGGTEETDDTDQDGDKEEDETPDQDGDKEEDETPDQDGDKEEDETPDQDGDKEEDETPDQDGDKEEDETPDQGGDSENVFTQLTQEEWETAVLNTINAKNYTLNMTNDEYYEDYTVLSSETAEYDMEQGLAYWSKEESGREEDYTYESYQIFSNNCREKYYHYDNDEWVYQKSENFYEDFDEELINLKCGVGKGYDAVEMLKYIIFYEYYLEGSTALVDMWEHFDFNEDDGTYTFTEAIEDDGIVYNYTIKFADGYISYAELSGVQDNGDTAKLTFTFSDFGTTVVQIPQELK